MAWEAGVVVRFYCSWPGREIAGYCYNSSRVLYLARIAGGLKRINDLARTFILDALGYKGIHVAAGVDRQPAVVISLDVLFSC